MKTIKAIHTAPVKSLGLHRPGTVHVGPAGIVEDRRLHLIDRNGRLLTQRQIGELVQIKAEYQPEPEYLWLHFPDGTTLEGRLEDGEPVITRMFGGFVRGRTIVGDWNSVLSDFCGQPATLVKSEQPGQSYDEYPLSLMSQASIDELGRQPGANPGLDCRRFRPNLLIEGCEAHEEDSWLDQVVQIGEELRLRIVARDPRCAITTHDPETGETDMDTIRLILNYRPDQMAAYFGVYGIVERPGTVSIGDVVVERT